MGKKGRRIHNLKDYQEIKSKLDTGTFAMMEKFVQRHGKYTMSDVMYDMNVFKKFENWQELKSINHLEYYYVGLCIDYLIPVTVEDLMNELSQNPKLKEYVLAYANNELKENSSYDKKFAINAIETLSIDSIYNYDTEVRENFVLSFKKGCKNLIVDLSKERNKRLQQEKSKKKEVAR